MINRNKFMQNILPRIFDSGDIESILVNSYKFMNYFFPVDVLDLSYHIKGADYITRACTVDRDSVYRNLYLKIIDKSIPMSCAEDIYLLSEHVKKIKHKIPCKVDGNSCIVIKCNISEEITGNLAIKVYKEDLYSRHHMDLVKKLAVPFSMVLAKVIAESNVITFDPVRLASHRKITFEESCSAIVGSRGMLKEAVRNAYYVSKYSSAVLLTGETGAGKEVFSNYIHRMSSRRDKPFVKINCATIPETLIDNELFGHERGAFTGADCLKKGRFELAHEGTLFLDEIGEMPLQSQTKMLRALQFGEIERLGGKAPVKVDVRVVAATNRDLVQMVRDGKFREDLYWRLNVFPIRIPPVRERKKDIPLLVEHILKKVCCRLGIKKIPVISEENMQKLVSYSWPGNVREMENVLEREIIISHNKPLSFKCLDIDGWNSPEETSEESLVELDHVMREHILKVLKSTNWRVSGECGAAEVLGLHPNTLRFRMKKLGIR